MIDPVLLPNPDQIHKSSIKFIFFIGYQIEKMPVNGRGGWTAVNATPVSGTTFTVPNLIEGSEWEFRVVAINDAGPGKPSKTTGPHRVRDPICKLFVSKCPQ